jgi:hypothetical protein
VLLQHGKRVRDDDQKTYHETLTEMAPRLTAEVLQKSRRSKVIRLDLIVLYHLHQSSINEIQVHYIKLICHKTVEEPSNLMELKKVGVDQERHLHPKALIHLPLVEDNLNRVRIALVEIHPPKSLENLCQRQRPKGLGRQGVCMPSAKKDLIG